MHIFLILFIIVVVNMPKDMHFFCSFIDRLYEKKIAVTDP